MIRTLRLFFMRDEGTKYTVSFNYAKGVITAQMVQDLAEAMLDEEFFAEGLAGFAGADLTARTTTVIV